jgi:hypothetical protein
MVDMYFGVAAYVAARCQSLLRGLLAPAEVASAMAVRHGVGTDASFRTQTQIVLHDETDTYPY